MKLIFAGTSEFAVPTLSALEASDHELALIWTQPARPAGRGRRLRPSPVQAVAEAAGLAVETPPTLAAPAVRERIAAVAPDALIVVAYGCLVPAALLAVPRLGGLNLHPSLLPRWRGAAPVARAILGGDVDTGIAVMRMTDELDAGPVYRSVKTAIGEHETAGELSTRLAVRGAQLLLETLASLAAGEADVRPQRGEATYAERLSPSEARLDFARTAALLARQVRAYNPRPIAWTTLDGERLRLLRAEALGESAVAAPGTIVEVGDAGLDIATGEGLLRVSELQRAGRRVQTAAEFARGQQWAGRQLG